MDRISQLRGGAGGSRDTSLDGSALGDSFTTANDTSSKYFSLSEDDSFDITKDVSLATTSSENTLNDSDCFSNLSPIGKKDLLDYKIGKQIEAANILSGGVNIFDDNENSYDGNELVIDDNVEMGDKSPTVKSPENPVLSCQNDNVDKSPGLKLPDSSDLLLQNENDETGGSSTLNSLGCSTLTLQDVTVETGEKSPDLKSPEGSELSLDKVDQQSVEGPDLPLERADEPVIVEPDPQLDPAEVQAPENVNLPLGEEAENGEEQVVDNNHAEEVNENRTGVVLQIDGNNVDAINIGTGLYLYRKEGQEELAAVQIVEDEEPSFKFLKVRENLEGNLEVYEEIQEVIVVQRETPVREVRPVAAAPSAARDTNKPANEPSTSKPVENKQNTPGKDEQVASTSKQDNNAAKDVSEAKSELNLNGKMVKFSESRKSPLMAYHSTPNKEGIPLTKTMVDQQLHPNRHSDNVKKTIEVHTDNSKQKFSETPTKSKDAANPDKMSEEVPHADKSSDKETPGKKHISIVTKEIVPEAIEKKIEDVAGCSNSITSDKVDSGKGKEEVVKDLTGKAEKTVDKALIVSEEEKGMLISSKRPEIPTEIPHTSSSIHIEDMANVNIIVENKPLNETTTKKDDAKEKLTSTVSSIVEAPLQGDKFDAKISENNEPKENPIAIPTEMLELDDVVKDALVIENQIGSHPVMKESENKELEPGALNLLASDEVQPMANESLNRTNDLGTGDAKLSTFVETKVTNAETLDTSKPSNPIDGTTAIPKSNCNLNVVTKPPHDKSVLENKLDDKVDTQNSLSKNEVSCTNSQDTQLNHNFKLIGNTKPKEITTLAMQNHNPEKLKAKDASGGNKPTTFDSSINPNAKINAISNKIQNKTDSLTSKVESMGKKQDKKEELNVKSMKDVKTPSLLLQQQATSLPKYTQNVVSKPQSKSDLKPSVVNAAETNKETNHKTTQNAVDSKPKFINNNHAPVPFGKWTEANRQDFLNKIKESKVPVNMSNANQLKQPNDLNRRDVLKKIDSQRQTYNANIKIQESLQKGNVKTETAFASKITPATVTKPLKSEAPVVKSKPILIKKPVHEPVQPAPQETTVAPDVPSSAKNETQRKEINNQDLIDKTIEGIINRAVTGKAPEEVTENPIPDKIDKKQEQKSTSQPTLLDAIEMKMNELHGIPFVERPPHELPRPYLAESNVSTKNESQNIPQKVSKIPNLLPLTKSQQKLKDCEDDIINQETPTEKSSGQSVASKLGENSLVRTVPPNEPNKTNSDQIITEKEFDKFARRNSVTYENCLTVTDSHQVIQTIMPREAPPKKISRNEQMLAEAKAKSPHKHVPIKQYHPSKAASKFIPITDNQNKQYQSKLQLAYQTAITAKRRIHSPITIIEDKPVKVVYLDSNVSEFTTGPLNVQGRDLSPAKRPLSPARRPLSPARRPSSPARRPEPDALAGGTDSLDSDILDAMRDVRPPDDTRTKSKHQRKQVLTPVETPDLELIEPGDLGIDVSPKKKRKTEAERSQKNLVPKKSYLLGRSAAPPRPAPAAASAELPLPAAGPPVTHDAVSAIDSLVKAAELLDNQSESMNASSASVDSVDGAQGTPVKRGRGRPRKHPLPAGADVKVSPQKKPRLIDAKTKRVSSSDDDSSDDDSMIKENWTMGKINEKIVCPICNKLFRSENVVFKHVKHCAGPSPTRSDRDDRSPRRARLSQESESLSRDSEVKSRDSRQDDNDDDLPLARTTTKKRKSKDSGKSSSSERVIPSDPKEPENDDLPKKNESRKTIRPRINPRTNNLVCEICGKSFRQLSYLVSHKLQHKKEDAKRPADVSQSSDRSVFSCETCKKEFRKLHHLVQHRLIHNPVQTRALRKTSSEQKEVPKGQDAAKVEDQSAGFRCEPCDKSFRKLHHLVEHRETHDGINRQRSNSVTQVAPEKEKLTPPPQCDICKKTFRKLHHLIEHKEQHLETSSEKSDDQKSVKSSLSTKDIIHECNLCYMVFPNEHSLNKHAVNCLRKKKQSAAKQAASLEEKSAENGAQTALPEENKVDVVKEPQPIKTGVVEEEVNKSPENPIDPPAKVEVAPVKEDPPKAEVLKLVEKVEKTINEPKPTIEKKAASVPETPILKVVNKPSEPAKIKIVDEIIIIEDTPKKKVPPKDKVAPTVTKRQKVATALPAVVEPVAPPTSSDEDEVRYMLNPDFNADDTAESKNFMKVRAKKRSSLQIERRNSKDFVRRRSLLQHPPKIPRLRAKSDDVATNAQPKSAIKKKVEKVEVPSTDSDDSDVKYSFPKTVPEKPVPAAKQEPAAEIEKKRRTTMVDKRKSLSGIAKRKSLGKAIAKPAAKPSPVKPIKRRTMAAEHRCDCGALFSSAALLARHASLAHTPPRVRRRRDPAPAPSPAPASAPATTTTPQPRKPGASADSAHKPAKPTRKSTTKDTARKLDSAKTARLRNRVHSGVPLPEKRMPRKL